MEKDFNKVQTKRSYQQKKKKKRRKQHSEKSESSIGLERSDHWSSTRGSRGQQCREG